MKTLNIIQKLSKIGKVLCKIMFIFCIIGFCGCIVGIFSMALGAETLKFGGVTLESILNTEAEVTIGTVYAAMAAGMILCAGEAVLAKFAEHYFKRELADGTPFTFAGAKEMQRLGILISVLTMQAFIEYVPLMILSQFISIGLYISMMRDNPAQITYLIYTLFSMVCQFIALKKVLALYKQQKSFECKVIKNESGV